MSDEQLSDILRRYRIVAAVGLSSKQERPSHGVDAYLQSHGYRIIPVNPNETEVLGEKAYPDLDSIPGPVEIVQVFRRSEVVPEIVEAAIRKGAKVVWMQDGTGNAEAAARATAAGIEVVSDDCMRREHERLMG